MPEGWEERRDTMAKLISASSLVLCLIFSFSQVFTSFFNLCNLKLKLNMGAAEVVGALQDL